jgi:hypothetical protein
MNNEGLHRSAAPAVALAALTLVAFAACSGGEPASPGQTGGTPVVASPSAAETSSPEPAGPIPFPQVRNTESHLSEGTYVTSTFADPLLTMTLPGPWTLFDQGPTNLQINMGSRVHLESQLSAFSFFGRVVDPGDDHTIVETNDLISWIEQNPHLVVIGRPSSVRIGGAKGREIDFRPVDAPLCTYYSDGSRCWNLMPIIDGDPFTPENQELGTMYVVGSDPESPDVPMSYRLALLDFDGSEVVFIWQEEASAFDQTVKTFERVLASIEVGV